MFKDNKILIMIANVDNTHEECGQSSWIDHNNTSIMIKQSISFKIILQLLVFELNTKIIDHLETHLEILEREISSMLNIKRQ